MITTNELNITEEICIDRMEPTSSRAYDISLVESKGQRYVSIRQQYKKKTDPSWNTRKAIWIPFEHAEIIGRIFQQACEEGKRRHWGATPSQSSAKTTEATVDVAKELLEVKKTLERLESYIHDTEAEKEQKAHLKLIERILKALS